MNLGIGNFTYDDLYSHARLRDLALTFDRFVKLARVEQDVCHGGRNDG